LGNERTFFGLQISEVSVTAIVFRFYEFYSDLTVFPQGEEKQFSVFAQDTGVTVLRATEFPEANMLLSDDDHFQGIESDFEGNMAGGSEDCSGSRNSFIEDK
jgi:hypothetical protein